MQKVRWGVLGVSKIATTKVIPAMQRGEWCKIAGIASRDRAKAQEAARSLGIPKAYGSYEEMLEDPEIEAVYNPLPNHMHVPWSIRAAEAGKHVLCEKPIGMNVAETLELMAARDRTGVVMGEAFMVQSHPQWLRTMELVRAGRIGQLRSAVGSFSYFKLDAGNIRNIREYGGGGLMDIGCYPIKTSRMVFGEEPARVSAAMVRDARFGNIDMLTSAILDYPSGHCIFTCSTQEALQQSMRFYGTTGRIELDIPFNAPENRPSRIRIDDGRDLTGSGATVEEFPACDQYTIQGDLFSRAIREGGAPPVPLEDALKNMAVIDAIVRSAETGQWVEPAEILKGAK
ncbi:MAG: Gfo/Idh/MocA family oxidoreductase [Bryobacteraceae bacterium]|jgi:predicted dehydrogenase